MREFGVVGAGPAMGAAFYFTPIAGLGKEDLPRQWLFTNLAVELKQ